MSLDIGELVGKLSVDDKQFDKGLKDGEQKFQGFGGKITKLATSIGAAAALGFGGAFAAGVGKEAIKAASDLAETQSKVQVIFGKSAKDVEAFGDRAAKAMGQSKQQALDAVSTFAIYGKQAKLSGEHLLDFSTDLTTLASDMASFSNTSPEEAIAAIGSALRGESDPIEKYGVLLNESVIQQKALQMGLIKTTTQALTPQQRVLAATAAIYGQTKAAQHDFARTSSGLANQTRILTAEWENAKTTLGAQLLPYALKFAHTLGEVAEFVKRNQAWITPLVTTLGVMAGVIYTIVTAAKAWTAAQIALNIAMDANPIGLIVLAIAALVAGLIWAYGHVGWFKKLVDNAFRGFKIILGAVVGWIVNTAWPWLQKAWAGIAAGAMWLWHNVLEPVGLGIIAAVRGIAAVAMWLWRNVIWPAAQGIGMAISFVMRIVRSVANLFFWLGRQVVAPVINFMVGYIRFLGAIAMWLWRNALLPAWNGIVSATRFVGSIFAWLYHNAIQPAISGIGAAVTWVWTKILSPAFTLIMGIVHKVGSTFRSVFSAIAGFVTGAFGKAVAIAKGAINGLIDLLNKAIGFINKYLVGGLNKVPGVDFPAIPTLPKLAHGGTVHPTPGGRPVIMGDGGQVEYGLPRSDLLGLLRTAMAASGGGQTITLILRGDGVLQGIRETVRIEGGDPAVLVGG